MTSKTTKHKKQAQKRGLAGEWRCKLALILTGWSILHHSYSSRTGSGAGEIDLIARRGHVLAFIEVKTKPNLTKGLDAVSADQQARITRGAERYIAQHLDLTALDMRFDLMIVRPWRWPIHITDVWRLYS